MLLLIFVWFGFDDYFLNDVNFGGRLLIFLLGFGLVLG